MCEQALELFLIHQDAFAADYREVEFTRLGRAIEYAGLHGKVAHDRSRCGKIERPMAA
jgi:hypothetical protein